MFRQTSGTLGAMALMLVVSAGAAVAAGVTVTNRDDKEHKITVIEQDGTKKTDHVLKANQVLEGLCPKGCVIRLNDSEEDEYELEGTETVSIEEGYLYYDGEPPAETPAAPGAQPQTPPATPGAQPQTPPASPGAQPQAPPAKK